ncbi:uncharacterized protein LOC110111397 [Dendrobium catenatum]|uniref:uncharacterized protein LOC110111397 n=1 Tax=Dendrobium catenatum TaxID=906689 RepID=UPI0009F41C08|nr:uncharacterized protein LOC110111397 [Dendrobium catenatum]
MVDWGAIQEESMQNEELKKVREGLMKGSSNHSGYYLEEERLLYQGRFVMPRTSVHIPHILQKFHGSAVGGHSEVHKTYRRLALELYKKGMYKDVEEMVARCEVCQRNKYMAMAPRGLLQPLALLTNIFASTRPLLSPTKLDRARSTQLIIIEVKLIRIMPQI